MIDCKMTAASISVLLWLLMRDYLPHSDIWDENYGYYNVLITFEVTVE